MFFKLIALFAAVAACSAVTLHGFHNYYVNIEGSHIVLTGKHGRQVDIFTDHLSGQYGEHVLHVEVNGPDMELKTYQIPDHPVVAGNVHQSDIIFEIFSKFVGQLDDQTYEQLLHIISKHVQTNDIHPVVLHALHYLYYLDQGFQGGDYDVTGYHYGQSVPYHQLGHRYGQWGSHSGVGSHIYSSGVEGHHYGPWQKQYGHHYGGYYGPYTSDVSVHGYGYVPQHWSKFGGQHGLYGQGHFGSSGVGAHYGYNDVQGHHYWPHHQYNQFAY